MAKYGNFKYGTQTYSTPPRLENSVEPMSILVVSKSKVLVSWQSPVGDFTQLRLVRNQAGFPEHPQDGIVIWEEQSTEGNVSRSSFTDGEDNPSDPLVTPGKEVYYRMFLYNSLQEWVIAGSIYSIIPFDHGMQEKVMDMLPRVYTSAQQSPLGIVDTTSALYKFFDGIDFSLEEFLTYIDLLRPQHNDNSTPLDLLAVEEASLGLVNEAGLPTRNRKRLIREALYMYSRRGTRLGLETYSETLTGWAPTISVSSNLMLTVQDSTFYRGIGNWIDPTDTAEIEVYVDSVDVPETNAIDLYSKGKIVTSTSGFISLGGGATSTEPDVMTKGIPVNPSTEYIFSGQFRSEGTVGMKLGIRFYDKNGNATSATTFGTQLNVTSSFTQLEAVATSDATSSYALLVIQYNSSPIMYADALCFQEGNVREYDEARAITIYANPNKVNYIINPSFEIDTTNWSILTGGAGVTNTLDTDVPATVYSGTQSLKLETTGTFWQAFPASTYVPETAPGTYWTFSAYVKGSKPFRMGVYNQSGSLGFYEEFTPPNSDWNRYAITMLLPEDTVALSPYMSYYQGGDPSTFYIDCVQLEQSIVATDYFDGGMTSAGAVWEGTAHASASDMYYGKNLKFYRLAETLNNWVPMNTFWRVTSSDGVEYTNLSV